MRSPVTIITFLTAIFTVAIVHTLAIQFSLYWRYPWFDFPMHVLGGSVVALSVFVMPLFNVRIPSRYIRIIPVLSFVFVVGLLWELFEFTVGIPPVGINIITDTFADFTMNFIGGTIGFTVGNNIRTL